MSWSQWLPFFIGTLVLSVYLTRQMIRLAPRLGLLDVPNSRSSHVRSMPRGGGVAVMLSFVLAVLLGQQHWSLLDSTMGWGVAGAVCAGLLGFVDDRWPLPVWIRLLVLTGISVFVIAPFSIGTDPSGSALHEKGELLILLPVGILGFVWLTNLFNFMDGVDGIAILETIMVSGAMSSFFLRNGDVALLFLSLALFFASMGFLFFNWSPARIFMGDVGSYFIGFSLALLVFWGHLRGSLPLASAFILLGTFVSDASWTLLVRILTGQKFTAPHRDHAYQHLNQQGWSHSKVSSAYGLANGLWLLPMAQGAALYPGWQWWIVVVAYVPLILFGIRMKAGRKIEPGSK